jgi:pimeloyl-ACP methyl ester carboxylesterase
VRAIFHDLEEDFVVVAWDQRGVGKSYEALDPAATLTLDRAVTDAIEVTNYLRQRFAEEKIYLAGVSWGSTLGVLAVQRSPELFHAWIGSGQMVSQRETDQRLYTELLALADERGDAALRGQLEAYGAPPYQDLMAYVFVMGYYEALTPDYTPSSGYLERGRAANLGPWGVLAREYNLVEKVNVMRGFMDEASLMYPQLQGLDFRRDVPRLDVPVYIFDGEAELTARRDLAWEWFDMLDAPSKQMFTFAGASHTVAMEQVDEFHRILLETIVPETYLGD